VHAEAIGRVTSARGIRIFYKGRKMVLKR
jgi:hypothetical protein